MNKAIPIMSTIAIMILVNAIPSSLAVSTNDTTTTPPLTPGYHIWHGTRYAVCPPGIPAPCAFVDIVDSTRITSSIDSSQKVRKYYEIFLNTMAAIARSLRAKIVKNVVYQRYREVN
jgi:hypothetical protein